MFKSRTESVKEDDMVPFCTSADTCNSGRWVRVMGLRSPSIHPSEGSKSDREECTFNQS